MKTEEDLDLNTAWFWGLPQPKYSSQFEECNALEVKNNIIILIELWAWISLKVGGLRANFTSRLQPCSTQCGLRNKRHRNPRCPVLCDGDTAFLPAWCWYKSPCPKGSRGRILTDPLPASGSLGPWPATSLPTRAIVCQTGQDATLLPMASWPTESRAPWGGLKATLLPAGW